MQRAPVGNQMLLQVTTFHESNSLPEKETFVLPPVPFSAAVSHPIACRESVFLQGTHSPSIVGVSFCKSQIGESTNKERISTQFITFTSFIMLVIDTKCLL